MSFHEENIPAFLENFEIIKEKIRNAPGNRLLELYQDKTNKCIFFTYSYWEDEVKLNQYRYSDTFAEVWPQTKALFSAPAEAWTTDTLVYLP